jgi:hypothetical protein
VGVKYFTALPGRKILEIPAAGKEEWVNLAKPLTEKYITEKTAMGLPAADFVKYLWERGEYWNKNYIGDDKVTAWAEKIEEVDQRVFSRYKAKTCHLLGKDAEVASEALSNPIPR